MKWVKKLVTASAFVYLFGVSYAVFFARRRRNTQAYENDRYVNLVPIKTTIDNYLTLNPKQGGAEFTFYSNLFGNIFLFIPMPFVLSLLFKIESKKILVLLSFVLSCNIELLQYLFKIGIPDVDDVLLNTIGAIIGLLMFKVLKIK